MFTTPITPVASNPNNAPQFGWDSSTHRAIERSAIKMLPSSALRNFAQNNLHQIQDISALQDQDFKGPQHWLELDTFPEAAPGRKQRTFKKVFKYFVIQENDKNVLKQWENFDTNVLTEHGDNAFAAIAKNYWQLTELLKQCKNENLLNTKNTNLSKKITTTMGQLAHYVGDLHQPLHTTGYFDWDLKHHFKTPWNAWVNSMHLFTDAAFSNHKNINQWRNEHFKQFKKTPALKKPLKNGAMRQLVLNGAINTHSRINELVQMDNQARKTTKSGNQYTKTLLKSWAPVAKGQMDAATRLLNTLLQSAYLKAGSPANITQAH